MYYHEYHTDNAGINNDFTVSWIFQQCLVPLLIISLPSKPYIIYLPDSIINHLVNTHFQFAICIECQSTCWSVVAPQISPSSILRDFYYRSLILLNSPFAVAFSNLCFRIVKRLKPMGLYFIFQIEIVPVNRDFQPLDHQRRSAVKWGKGTYTGSFPESTQHTLGRHSTIPVNTISILLLYPILRSNWHQLVVIFPAAIKQSKAVLAFSK